MKVYHMSDTLPLGAALTPDYKGSMELVAPFVQALERSEDCFYAMLFNAQYLRAVLGKFGQKSMATNYAKWAAEGVFEYVRRREFPACCCRITGHYFFADIRSCQELFSVDWGGAPAEERSRIRLYEVELEDDAPQKRDMRMYDEAFDALWERSDLPAALECARRYFRGEATAAPVWELLSDKKAVAVRDLTRLLDETRSPAL